MLTFLIFIGSNTFHILPKRAFANDAERSLARDWLMAKLTPKKNNSFIIKAGVLWLILMVAFYVFYQFLARQHR